MSPLLIAAVWLAAIAGWLWFRHRATLERRPGTAGKAARGTTTKRGS